MPKQLIIKPNKGLHSKLSLSEVWKVITMLCIAKLINQGRLSALDFHHYHGNVVRNSTVSELKERIMNAVCDFLSTKARARRHYFHHRICTESSIVDAGLSKAVGVKSQYIAGLQVNLALLI